MSTKILNNLTTQKIIFPVFQNFKEKMEDFSLEKENSFEKIKSHFNSLNLDESHFVNSNDICTPIECVKEMVDSIPNDFWQKKDLKILDSCCGNGNFHGYIATKTNLKNLYFNEINSKRIENLKDYFGENINLTIQDFLSFSEKAEYDLVVSNPPYAKFNINGRTSKNHNLSRDFIKKALEITKENGYILFIVPNNWMSFSDRNVLPKLLTQYQFLQINIHGAKKWFPKVGSSFTWFLLQKTENKLPTKIENHYIIKDIQFVNLKKAMNFIPLYYSKIVQSILNKTIDNEKIEKYKIETTSDLHKTTKKKFISEEKSDIFRYKLIHTPTQIVWASCPHKFQEGFKVFLSLTNQYKVFVDDCGMTQSIAFIRCESKKEAEKIKQDLENDLYFFLNNIARFGNFNNVRVLQKFPVLKNVKLSQEEWDFIKLFNQKYYGKKEK